MGINVMQRNSNCNIPSDVKVDLFKYKTDQKIETLGNPNARNFQIIATKQIGEYLIAEILYPDCKNYEGKKILLYKGINLKKLVKENALDPHFCDEKNHVHPIARFVPNKEGWEMAEKLCEVLCSTKS